ncbi:MAG: oxidoreductase [Betaproteobacteria bacterium HGW-Betaproteobacteria-12]|nr:MAG: oxidoreductase [Betaproteobacteria bacterium HGW-Betaproteobacteria-12]
MSTLFSPLQIKSMHLSNRVFVAPMCQYSGVDGKVGDWHWQHLGALAIGGAGAITIESTAVLPEGRITRGCLGLYDDEQTVALAVMVGYLRRLSPIRIGLQLNHGGRKASCHEPWRGGEGLASDAGGWDIVGPSPIAFGKNRAMPQELDTAGMERIAAAFASAARRAGHAGLDYVELHMAHGYLLHSFLSPVSNRRSDEFGGSLAKRMRFPLEVVARVRAAWPENKPLGVRLNCRDWHEGGLEFADTLAVCAALKAAGVDFVCISAGAIAEGVRIPAAPGYLVEFAAQVRAQTGLLTRVVGLLDDPVMAEAAVAAGHVDGVAIGRAMLYDPRWALKAARQLGVNLPFPSQYMLCSPQYWSGPSVSLGK